MIRKTFFRLLWVTLFGVVSIDSSAIKYNFTEEQLIDFSTSSNDEENNVKRSRQRTVTWLQNDSVQWGNFSLDSKTNGAEKCIFMQHNGNNPVTHVWKFNFLENEKQDNKEYHVQMARASKNEPLIVQKNKEFLQHNIPTGLVPVPVNSIPIRSKVVKKIIRKKKLNKFKNTFLEEIEEFAARGHDYGMKLDSPREALGGGVANKVETQHKNKFVTNNENSRVTQEVDAFSVLVTKYFANNQFNHTVQRAHSGIVSLNSNATTEDFSSSDEDYDVPTQGAVGVAMRNLNNTLSENSGCYAAALYKTGESDDSSIQTQRALQSTIHAGTTPFQPGQRQPVEGELLKVFDDAMEEDSFGAGFGTTPVGRLDAGYIEYPHHVLEQKIWQLDESISLHSKK